MTACWANPIPTYILSFPVVCKILASLSVPNSPRPTWSLLLFHQLEPSLRKGRGREGLRLLSAVLIGTCPHGSCFSTMVRA